jgi:hypothetical protein
MRKFNVIFEVFDENGQKEMKTVAVEAGNKKLAALRGMQTINKLEGYSEKFKNVVQIEEVA